MVCAGNFLCFPPICSLALVTRGLQRSLWVPKSHLAERTAKLAHNGTLLQQPPLLPLGSKSCGSSQKPPRGRRAWAGCWGAGAGKTSPSTRAPLSHPSLTWDLCGVSRQRARRTQRQGWEAGGQGRGDHGGCRALSLLLLAEEEGEEEGEEGSRASSGLRAPSCGCELRCCSSARECTFPPGTEPVRWLSLLVSHFCSLCCSLLTPSAFHPLPAYLGRRKGGFGSSWGTLHGFSPARSNACTSLTHSSLFSVQTWGWEDQEGPFTAPVPP